MLRYALLLLSLVGTIPLHAELLLSNTADATESFPFNVSAHGFYIPLGRIFVGASEAVANNAFAVASALRTSNTFKALTPQFVKLNNAADSLNPLFGAAINNLAPLGAWPIVTKAGNPSSIFLIEDSGNQIGVYEASNIQDSQGQTASSLLSMTTNATQVFEPLSLTALMATFAAIGNKNGGFDGNGSGIALLFFKRFTSPQGNTSYLTWDIVDATTGTSQFNDVGEPTGLGNKPIPIDTTTAAIKIGNPVSAIGNTVDLHFDRDLGRLYIALNVQGGNAPTDGARAVVVAALSNGRLILQNIAPDSAFADNTKIVGGVGQNAQISISKVRTLQTRTYLRYLIVVGGNGNDPNVQSNVYALPLVDNLASASHGALANVNAAPGTLFGPAFPARPKGSDLPQYQRFRARVFYVPAVQPSDLYSMNSPGARVGGNGILPSAVTDIVVAGESVFVSVGQPGNDLAAGIFYSQPLFDTLGRVTSWTDWQRVGGTADAINGFGYDPLKGIFFYIPQVLTNSITQMHSVYRTAWSDGTDPLGLFISGQFTLQNGGVQGLQDVPFSTQSLTTQVGQRLSFQIFTGFKKVVLLQTGQDQNGLFTPVIQTEDIFQSKNGTLSNFSPSPGLAISGGVIDQLGPLDASAVVTDGTYGWIAVGGSGGVGILADSSGAGYPAQPGLRASFQGLTSAMSFIKISSAQNVRKMVAVGNNLFVLTTTSLIRYTISASALKTGNISASLLAQLTQEQLDQASSYSDVIISGPLALLATSFGLLRSGNFVSIQTVTNQVNVGWTAVPLPESAGSLTNPGPVSRLFAISPTGFETNVALGGTVYVLNAYVGFTQAQIYRFVLQLTNGAVTDSSVTIFPDLFIQGLPTFFAHLGDYKNYVVTDGALIAVSRSAFGKVPPVLELLPSTIKSGEAGAGRNLVPFVMFKKPDSSIGKLLRSSASGAWIVPGDFGVRVQQ